MERKQAVLMVHKYLKDNDLQDWDVGFMNRKTTAGTCFHFKKCIRLSNWFVKYNSCKRVSITVLHEIAHARLGSGFGHGGLFKASCDFLGVDNAKNTFINNDTYNVNGLERRCEL